MREKFYVYVARCVDGTLYTGYTDDLRRRLQFHNAGKGAKYTRTRRPIEIVYSEDFGTKGDAMRREYEIKKLSRDEKKELIGG